MKLTAHLIVTNYRLNLLTPPSCQILVEEVTDITVHVQAAGSLPSSENSSIGEQRTSLEQQSLHINMHSVKHRDKVLGAEQGVC